jgi:hypothetical protein
MSEKMNHAVEANSNAVQSGLDAVAEFPELCPTAIYAKYEHRFAAVTNNSMCPCGSENIFKDCCKSRWQFASRGWKNRDREKKKVIKEEHRKEKKVRWLCKLGVDEHGNAQITQTQETKGMPLDPAFLGSLFLELYHQMNVQTAVQIARQTFAHMMESQPIPDQRVKL